MLNRGERQPPQLRSRQSLKYQGRKFGGITPGLALAQAAGAEAGRAAANSSTGIFILFDSFYLFVFYPVNFILLIQMCFRSPIWFLFVAACVFRQRE